jgi:hypothetical protein
MHALYRVVTVDKWCFTLGSQFERTLDKLSSRWLGTPKRWFNVEHIILRSNINLVHIN